MEYFLSGSRWSVGTMLESGYSEAAAPRHFNVMWDRREQHCFRPALSVSLPIYIHFVLSTYSTYTVLMHLVTILDYFHGKWTNIGQNNKIVLVFKICAYSSGFFAAAFSPLPTFSLRRLFLRFMPHISARLQYSVCLALSHWHKRRHYSTPDAISAFAYPPPTPQLQLYINYKTTVLYIIWHVNVKHIICKVPLFASDHRSSTQPLFRNYLKTFSLYR